MSFFDDITRGATRRADEWLRRGGEQYDKGQIHEAQATWMKALELYRQQDEARGMLACLGNLGNVYHALGKYRDSLKFHRDRLKLAQNLTGTRAIEGRAHGDLGNAYMSLRDYDSAIASYERHLAIAREIDDRAGESNALGNLAHVFFLRGDYLRSIDLTREALACDRELGNTEGLHHGFTSLGNVYNAQGKYRQAISAHEEALAAATKLEQPRRIAYSRGNMADAYQAIGDYDEAMHHARAALDLFEALGEPYGQSMTQLRLGVAHISHEQPRAAIPHLTASLDLARQIEDARTESYALNNLGHAHAQLEHFDEAISFYEESLERKRRLGDEHGTAVTLGSLATIYRVRGQLDQAIALYREALPLTRGVPYGEGSLLHNLSIALLQAEDHEAAESVLRRAIEIWETLREQVDSDAHRIAIFEQQAFTYNHLQRTLITAGRPLAALEIAERGRTRALVALLGHQLAEASPREVSLEPLDAEGIRAVARQQRATLIFYSVIYGAPEPGDESGDPRRSKPVEIAIWVIREEGDIVMRTVALPKLAELLADPGDESGRERRAWQTLGVYRELRRPSQEAATDRAAMRRLYELLVEPIAAYLPREDPTRPVILVPDSRLFLLPFAALIDSHGRFLIDGHALLYTPSIQTLSLTARQRSSIGDRVEGALVVGNPTMPRLPAKARDGHHALAELPHAEHEALTIAEILHSRALIGNLASKDSVVWRMPGRRFIHLATHGLFDDENPEMPGAIVLAGATLEEALLTPSEIAKLDLDAELVVLSACNTGQGRQTEEGIIGLARAFVSAGAASVLVSLWSVLDDSTAFLMASFYRVLLAGTGKPQALRHAMRETRAVYELPEQWASFILIGETS